MKFSAFEELAKADNRTLENFLLRGKTPRLQSLVNMEFDGWNTNSGTALFGNRKFRKGFESVPPGKAFGYNMKVKQNHFKSLWLPTDKLKFGFFDVLPNPDEHYQQLLPYQHALLLDYRNHARNTLFTGKYLRDVLVMIEPNLYLEKAYHAFAGRLIPLSYFVMKPAEGTK